MIFLSNCKRMDFRLMKYRWRNLENFVYKIFMRKETQKRQKKLKKYRISLTKIKKLNQIGAKEQFLKSKLVFKWPTNNKFERKLKN